jgi:predicted amidohydrolase
MKPFAIAGIQMYVSAVHENVTRFCQKVETLMHVHPWIQMVLTSELALHGPLLRNAEPPDGPTERRLRQLAAHHGIWLIPGSLFQQEGDKIYNVTPVIAPDGGIVGRYRKMFPFMPYEQGVEPGTDFMLFDVPEVGRFGVSICYDMWFPETIRTLASMGAEVILHPSLTNTIDRELELVISRAAAIQNQCYFFDINGAGDGGNGRSIIVGPAGDVFYTAGTTEENMPVEIDLARVRRSREFGLRGLGQVLKSFRDRSVDFKVYDRNSGVAAYLDTLGPLEKPLRGSHVGMESGDLPATTGAAQYAPTPEEIIKTTHLASPEDPLPGGNGKE